MLDQDIFETFQKYHAPGDNEFMTLVPSNMDHVNDTLAVVFKDAGEWQVLSRMRYCKWFMDATGCTLGEAVDETKAMPYVSGTSATDYEARKELDLQRMARQWNA